MTAIVHHLPTAEPTLRDQALALTPGQWVRVTWHDQDTGTRGVIEGPVRKPSPIAITLHVGHGFCLMAGGQLNVDVVKVETTRPVDLDLDRLAELMEEWAEAVCVLDAKPVGRFKTGDNTREANAVYMAAEAVRAYLRGVTL
jgi:hypothetical protein